METTSQTQYDWKEIVASLNELLRLKATPVGMKKCSTKAEMEAIPKIRRPDKRYLLINLLRNRFVLVGQWALRLMTLP